MQDQNVTVDSNQWKEKGNQFFQNKKYEDAIKCYEEALKLNQKFKEVWHNQGLCYQKMGNEAAALIAFTQAIIIDPLYAKAVYNKANILFTQHKNQLALELIDAYFSAGGNDTSIVELRKKCANAQVKNLLGDGASVNPQTLLKEAKKCKDNHEYEKSGKYLQAVFILFPQHEEAKALLGQLQQQEERETSNLELYKTRAKKLGIFDKPTKYNTEDYNRMILNFMYHADYDNIRALLDNGMDVNTEVIGYSLLAFAAAEGYEKLVDLLLSRGAFVDKPITRGECETPIYLAAGRGHINIVRKLLEAGAAPNFKSLSGYTPIYVALSQGHHDIVRLLQEYENIYLLEMRLKNFFDAIKNGTIEKIKKSLWRENFQQLISHSNIKVLLAGPCDLEEKNKNLETPLLCLARYKGEFNFKTTLILIRAGCNIEMKWGRRQNLLDIIHKNKSVSSEMKQQMQQTIEEIKQAEKEKKVLAFAVKEGFYHQVVSALKNGEDINQCLDEDNNTPLMIALKNQHLLIVLLLIIQKADLQLKNKQGMTAKDIAHQMNFSKKIMALLFETKISDISLSTAEASFSVEPSILPDASFHAAKRKEQRKISSEAIQEVKLSGEKREYKESIIYINEYTKVVMGKDGTIITVMENKYNGDFDLSRKSKAREAELLREAKNNEDAMCELAEMYLAGDCGSRDFFAARQWLMKAAEANNHQAMLILAQGYENEEFGYIDFKAALEWWTKLADQENRYALAVLGQRYLAEYLKLNQNQDGLDAEKINMMKKIKSYLGRSADKGGVRAICQIAEIHRLGLFGEKNISKAIQSYIQAAKLGSVASLKVLYSYVLDKFLKEEEFENILEESSRFITRTSGEYTVELGLAQINRQLGKNTQKGFENLEIAARHNNIKAMKILAKYYAKEKAGVQNIERSCYWVEQLKSLYQKAADDGNVNAMRELACLNLKGSLCQIDLAKAEEMLIKAAKCQDTRAMLLLGRLYIEGRLGNKDPSEGLVWINKAIDIARQQLLKRDYNAAYFIAEIYQDKNLGLKNYDKSLQFFLVAEELGSIKAKFEQAKLYSSGKLVHTNLSQYIESFEKKIEQMPDYTKSYAQIILGDLYKKNKNEQKALFCYEQARKLETPKVINQNNDLEYQEIKLQSYRLGKQYQMSSEGKPKDSLHAAFWYRKSSKLGCTEATVELAKMYESGELGEKTRPVAINLYKQAAKEGHAQSIKALISHYKNGILTKQNPAKVKKWEAKEKSIRFSH